MIALPPSCLPAQISPIEFICSVNPEQREDNLMTITFETISKYLMVSPYTALRNRISEISLLHTNWNGNGAIPPSEHVLKNSFRFLDSIIYYGYANYIKPEDIVPTPYGTIDIDFESSQGLVSVEIGREKIGFFTEYNDKKDILSDGINTDFKIIPQLLQEALYNLEDHIDANAISA